MSAFKKEKSRLIRINCLCGLTDKSKLSPNTPVHSTDPITSRRESVMSVFTLQPECTESVVEQHVSRKLQQKTVGLAAQVIHRGSPVLMQLLAINGCYVGCRAHAVWLTLPARWAAVREAFILMKDAQRRSAINPQLHPTNHLHRMNNADPWYVTKDSRLVITFGGHHVCCWDVGRSNQTLL